ncbi:MAG: hypothetical protein KAH93_03655 [Candidatus Aenigmarchaeota archaeon]|nr:hypothetical protein [Candidatus Aenigmarchaeota archaeon]
MDFNSFLANLNSMGFYDFVLPWILFLVIFFVIIERAPFLTKETTKKKQIAIIIAAILAFFTVNFPVNGIPFGIVLSNMFGWTGVYVAAILVVILFLGMGGLQLTDLTGTSKFMLGLLLVLVAILVLGAAGFPVLRLDDMMWTLIFVLVLIGGAIAFLGSEPTPKEE